MKRGREEERERREERAERSRLEGHPPSGGGRGRLGGLGRGDDAVDVGHGVGREVRGGNGELPRARAFSHQHFPREVDARDKACDNGEGWFCVFGVERGGEGKGEDLAE